MKTSKNKKKIIQLNYDIYVWEHGKKCIYISIIDEINSVKVSIESAIFIGAIKIILLSSINNTFFTDHLITTTLFPKPFIGGYETIACKKVM